MRRSHKQLVLAYVEQISELDLITPHLLFAHRYTSRIFREPLALSGRVEQVGRCKTSLVRGMPLSIFKNNSLILEVHTVIQTIGFKIFQPNLTAAF